MQLSISGYKSAAKYWPGTFANVDSTSKLRILGALARLRPVLVKGYESMVMVGSTASHRKSGIQAAHLTHYICASQPCLRFVKS